ncbi:hypothetical protein SAY87_028792 [Trapa incisa]|uniref:Pentatricopeptide repeat-containing protein n=1 Tax=Trapa incisa TaxID=236973 RepID=A0AAN7KPS7_9MYRT|nr:hypothetical protein SAY87_028792 [Trapa incisa]
MHILSRIRSSSSSTVGNYVKAHLDSFLSSQICPTGDYLRKSHALIVTSGNATNAFLSAKLISLYATASGIYFSTEVFRRTPNKDTFLWNSIIKSHFSNGLFSQSLELFCAMNSAGWMLDQFTVPMVAAACGETGRHDFGMCIHGITLKCGLLWCNSATGSSLVYMYCKCGEIWDACQLFDEMTERDVVVWTTILIGCIQNSKDKKGLELFCNMLNCDVKPNSRTMEGGFQACGNLGAFAQGSCLHGLMVKNGLGSSQAVQCSVLSMYSKCGVPQETYKSFSEVVDKDIFAWTSVIGVHARAGKMSDCIALFCQMQESGSYPDGIVISCMFLGFGNSMNDIEGKKFHGLVLRRNYLFDEMVHDSLLSMYCRFGQLNTANKLFYRVGERSKEHWNMMISGYGKIGLEEKCIKLFKEMQCMGIEADSNSLVSVISSCSRIRATFIGRQLHCYVIKTSKGSEIPVVNSLIDFYGSYGDFPVALGIFLREPIDIASWNTLMASYAHNGHYADAIALFDRMIEEGINPNSATLVTILSVCSNLASLENGERFLKIPLMMDTRTTRYSDAAKITDYWVQNGNKCTLAEICASYNFVNIAFLSTFGSRCKRRYVLHTTL